MQVARRNAMMMAQYNKAVRDANEYIKFYVCEDDCNTWYLMLENFAGNNDEFVHGQYIVRMIAPKEFPFEPPQFYFMTPNGVYDIEKKICISIGEYHKDQYRAALGMSGFANQLVSGMIGWTMLGHGISILTTTCEQKKDYASASAAYNIMHHEDILNKIKTAHAVYSAKWTNK